MKQSALQLFLKHNRFDLIYKYLYVKQPNAFTRSAYMENIRAFNGFYELNPSDGIPKTSATDFLNSFDQLIANVKKNGFDGSWAVPIGRNGEITDGAHRLVVCAALGLEVETTDDLEHQEHYDYTFFLRKGMKRSLMDYGTLEYVRLNPNAYIVNLHAVTSRDKDEEIIKILNEYGFVYYSKEVHVTFNGYVNLKKLSYGSYWDKDSWWIGTSENKFAGAVAHAKRSVGKNPLRTFVFVCDDIQKVLKAKKRIRALYNMGNYSVHINDNHDEAVALAEVYFNENTLDLFNRRSFEYEDVKFDKAVEDLKKVLVNNNISLADVCLCGSTTLNVYGIRHSSDIDYLCIDDLDVSVEMCEPHDGQLRYYPSPKNELITNPQNYMFYKGIKVLAINVIRQMKRSRAEKPKDIQDCKLIKQFDHSCAKRDLKFKLKLSPIYPSLKRVFDGLVKLHGNLLK